MNTKKSSAKTTSLTFSPQITRVLLLQVCAVLLSITAGYFIWLYTIVDKEQQLLNKLSRQNAQYQQHILQSHLASVIEKITLYSRSKELSSGLLSADTHILSDYKNRLMKEIAGLKSVRFFGLNQARVEEADVPVNFVVIDMINRSEKGKVVHPEVLRNKKENTWFIAIVAPLYQTTDQAAEQSALPSEAKLKGDKIGEKVIGTMYLAMGVKTLQTLLSSLDQKLGQTQISQRISDQKFITFLSVGDAGNYSAQQLAVANSSWQLRYTPSMASYLRIKQPQVPVVLFIACITLLLMGFCWYIARLLNQWQGITPVSIPASTSSDTTKSPGTKKTTATDSVYHADSLFDLELAEEDQSLLDFEIDKEKVTVSDQVQQYNMPDNIFRAYDIRGIVDKQLTCELAEMIGRAFASEVLDKGDKAIFIGRDGRTHSPKIADAFTQGVLSTGCNIIDLGLVPTPLMNFATSTSTKTSSGVMVTASHNPREYNGFKFVIKGRTLVDQDMQAIKNSIVSGNFHIGQGKTESQNIIQHYIDRVFSDVALAGSLHVVIDAANGTTSAVAPALFEELGCTVTPLFCEIDGTFPNHDPDPSLIENLQPLIDKVKQEQADLGLAFDGDGDRLVVVTPKGRVIWPDQLMMLFSKDVVSRNPGCDIIYDVKSTRQLGQIIRRYGGRPIMWKTGHAHMKTKMRDTGALLAGEYSGHIFFKERWFGFDDGMYAAARLLEIISLGDRDIDAIFNDFPSFIATPEIKIPIGDDEKFTIIESLLAVANFANGKQSTIDGIRVDFTKGWGLIRASNTSAALTVRFEAETDADMEAIKGLFRRELGKVDAKLSTYF